MGREARSKLNYTVTSGSLFVFLKREYRVLPSLALLLSIKGQTRPLAKLRVEFLSTLSAPKLYCSITGKVHLVKQQKLYSLPQVK